MKYLSDKILTKDIESWNNKYKEITINSGTGSGKTTWIFNNLFPYAKKNNKTILYLANRKNLINQLVEKYGSNNESDGMIINSLVPMPGRISALTYQKVISDITTRYNAEESGFSVSDNINTYRTFDYVLLDEAHVFVLESGYIAKTDLLFDFIGSLPAIKIYMSATLKQISQIINPGALPYDFPFNNKPIGKVYFYKNPKVIDTQIINLQEKDKGKILYFFGDVKKAVTKSKVHKNSAFICADSDQHNLHDESNEEELENIKKYEKFNASLMCTTSVLYNGINFHDVNLKHIILDIWQPETIIQMIGRKRQENSKDKVNIYIKIPSSKQIRKNHDEFAKKLKAMDIISTPLLLYENQLIDYTGRNLNDDIFVTYEHNEYGQGDTTKIKYNEMKKRYYNYCLEFIDSICDISYEENKMIMKVNKNKFIDGMMRLINKKNYIILDDKVNSLSLSKKLSKHKGKKYFEEDGRDTIRNLFIEDVPVKDYHGNKKRHTQLNAYMIENDIPYEIHSKKEYDRNSENYDKKYWIIVDKNTA